MGAVPLLPHLLRMEATIICLDNSEWMRNGDFLPSRLVAQNDAAILLSTQKIDQHPESAVAVVSMAGKTGPKILVTLSNDDGKLMNAISSIKVEGQADVSSTLQMAELALKHKQNKSQAQRIVLFIGSPVLASTVELKRIGKRLKKTNIAVDIINFGETMENTEKLQAFHEAVNNNQSSHLLSVPTGPHNLSDYLSSFPEVFNPGFSGSSGGASNADTGGVDPNIDPELAAALRMSMEEYQSSSISDADESSPSQGGVASGDSMDVDDDDRMLQEALQMSMMSQGNTDSSGDAAASSGNGEAKQESEAPVPDAMDFEDSDDDDAGLYDDMDEEAQMALALEMSMAGGQSTEEDGSDKPQEASAQKVDKEEEDPDALVNDALNDPNFVNSIFDNLEGVDPNDPLIQSAIQGLNQKKEGDKKDDSDKK